MDYALTENPKVIPGRWEVIDSIDGFAGLGPLRPGEGLPFEKPTVGMVRSFALSEGKRWIQGTRGVWNEGVDGNEFGWMQE